MQAQIRWFPTARTPKLLLQRGQSKRFSTLLFFSKSSAIAPLYFIITNKKTAEKNN
jgi:hypothetical protein